MNGRTPARLLARTFFSRMFESDLMPAGMPQTQIVFSTIAFLGGPALAVPILFAKKYLGSSRQEVLRLMAQDRALVLLLAMLATAMVTLVLWEKVFPDRRDCRTLGVLPIAPNTFVLARLASIVGLFALLFAGSTALWAVTLGIVQSIFGAPGGPVRNIAGLFVAMAGLEAAVFFGIIGVQCLIVITAGLALAQRLAVLVQMLLVVAVLQLPLFLPRASPWFVSVYDVIAAGRYGGPSATVMLVAASAVVVPLAALLLYAASYRRLTRLAIEGRPVALRRGRLSLSQRFTWLASHLASTPAGTAVCAFTIRTLARSQQHRMLLSIWFGLAIALSISTTLPLAVRWSPNALDRPRAAVLVVPLIFTALVVTGIRMLYALPTEIKANWVFRLDEPLKPGAAIAGATAALAACGVWPAALLALLSASWLWGIGTGIKHALFCAALGTFLVQLLMRGVDKIPFTCTYVPGKARVANFWPAYLLAFSVFTYGMASLEADLLAGSTTAYLLVTLFIAATAGTLWWTRLLANSQMTGLRFQEEPEDQPTLLTLQ